MADIYNLFADLIEQKFDDIEVYFNDFFAESKGVEYNFDPLQNDEEKDSTLKMFGNGDIFERAKTVLTENNYCLEAFYVFYKMADDYNLYLYFDSMFSQINAYNSLSEYKKIAYRHILDEFVAFEMDLESYTQAAAIEEAIIEDLNIYDDMEISRLAFLYALKEDFENLYDLYLSNEDILDESVYIILIATALKNNEEDAAILVLNNLIDKYKYGDYIDHPWDLENIDDTEALLMADAISSSYRIIKSVPYFFQWCNEFKKTCAAKA